MADVDPAVAMQLVVRFHDRVWTHDELLREDAQRRQRIARLQHTSFNGVPDLLNELQVERLAGRGIEVLRFRKPTFTKPAPADLRREIGTRCHAVVEALAD